MKAVAIIPARYASTRFPGKPLAMIGGKPMLRHVYENVLRSDLFHNVIIATDDKKIYKAAHEWNATAVMTSHKHQSGTDRCGEVAAAFGEKAIDIVVNVQGDEPFISAEPLQKLIDLFQNKKVEIGTLVQKFENNDEILSPNTAKVVLAKDGKALYFSRAPIPYLRDNNDENILPFYMKHIGIYAFRASILKELVKLAPSGLEKAEKLEQLRWLENGYSIFAAETTYRTLSVDTPEDLKNAEIFYKEIKQ